MIGGADAEQILQRLKNKTSAYFNRDIDGVMSVYRRCSELCIFDPPIIYYGFDATEQMIRDFVDGSVGPMKIDYLDPDVRVSGDLACSWQVAHIRSTLRNGNEVDVRCRMTDVWMKENGEWFVIHEHNSLPMDQDRANDILSLSANTMDAISK
jgi:ketosteroid isomerase-like protein